MIQAWIQYSIPAMLVAGALLWWMQADGPITESKPGGLTQLEQNQPTTIAPVSSNGHGSIKQPLTHRLAQGKQRTGYSVNEIHLFDQLSIRAASGDADAAWQLSQKINRCQRQRLHQQNIALEADTTSIGQVPTQNQEWQVSQIEQQEVDCQHVFIKQPEASLSWLQLAAELGLADAQVAYFQQALAPYSDEASRLRHAGEVAQRLQQAHGFLLKARNQGHVAAFTQLAQSYQLGLFSEVDRSSAYAHWYAAAVLQNEKDMPQQDIQQQLTMLSQRMSATQSDEARASGEALLAQCCRTQ